MHKITLALEAMATRFELVLLGGNPVQLRAAGEEALEEIGRIDAQLSLYRASSEIAQVNARAGAEAVRVSPTTFALLEKARALWGLTGGAFDITVAPLVRCWGFMQGSGQRPADEQIEHARHLVGMDLLVLDADSSTVRFQRAGMMLDLGSIGKGYALDVAAEILRDAGVENALLHGGTSTIYGLGHDETGPWKIALEKPLIPSPSEIKTATQPPHRSAVPATPAEPPEPPEPPEPLAIIELQNQSMSMSAVWGKFFEMDGRTYGHVIDPRTGWPAENVLMGCVVAASAADSDALSTGVLLASHPEIERLSAAVPGLRFLQARLHGTEIKYLSGGVFSTDS